MPYGFRRWKGTVWGKAWVDRCNRQLDLIRRRFEDGWHVDDHVEDWYRMLTHFDFLAIELGTRDCRGR
ncbi:hypothetical protein [Rhodococcus opacus]|uniref:hypothetical protein n=1 Tax=Rhodococcus opacus TaxID=37919 RepID=UPI0029554613|nr:hypothetical protein [Rhodococcus opacus]MDV7085647.1 hypothetical protein [Rhodococcus opacus]